MDLVPIHINAYNPGPAPRVLNKVKFVLFTNTSFEEALTKPGSGPALGCLGERLWQQICLAINRKCRLLDIPSFQIPRHPVRDLMR